MSSTLSAISFRTNDEGQKYINSCTLDSFRESITKTAYNLISNIDCVKYDDYSPNKSDSVVVLVRTSDGLVIDKYFYENGISEFSAIKMMCKYLKRGKNPSDFKVLLMTKNDYYNADLMIINGFCKPCFKNAVTSLK